MRELAQELFDRAECVGWLQYRSNAQQSDSIIQARYYRAAAQLLMGQPKEAIRGLEVVYDAADGRWALGMQVSIRKQVVFGAPTIPKHERTEADEQADLEESQAENWARHPQA